MYVFFRFQEMQINWFHNKTGEQGTVFINFQFKEIAKGSAQKS